MRIDILSLFPEMFPGVLNASILGRAAQANLVEYHLHNIRDWADNKHAKVDDRPFGGGPGMVMMCQPLYDAVMAVEKINERIPATRILLTPQGQPLDQRRVEELATKPRLLLMAGHYEGVDERVIEEIQPLELSVGDYVLSGGELAAMIVIDAVVRLLPGALGHDESAAQDSFAERNWEKDCGKVSKGGTIESGSAGQRLLDCPHYTRPREWRGRTVPDVLLSGDHQAVEKWRRNEMIERTKTRRPDLLKRERQ
jgi:tRNA (guanine37-N1)-methyltransferase